MINMEANKLGIHYTVHPQQLVASIRTSVASRKDILNKIREFIDEIPKESIQGHPFCFFYYVTSVAEGTDVEFGVPVLSKFPSETFTFRTLPKMESFSIPHKGKLGDLGKAYGIVFKYADKYGYPSQEFSREVYTHIGEHEEEHEIDVQFIIHPWNRLLVENMNRVLGPEQTQNITDGLQSIEIETPLEDKFKWVVKTLEKLEDIADESQRLEIMSGCAHFFPEEMIAELHEVYLEGLKNSPSILDAVDTTLEYMKTHKGWGAVPIRKGNVLYTTKNPSDPKAFSEAKTHLEKIKAYCFCPIIKQNLDKGVPVTFCNCGAGWPKQLWEGVLQKSLKIEIVKSLTKGDEECQFAFSISDEK